MSHSSARVSLDGAVAIVIACIILFTSDNIALASSHFNDPAITLALQQQHGGMRGGSGGGKSSLHNNDANSVGGVGGTSSLLEVSARTGGIPMLSPEKCATIANAPPQEPILEKERCSLCEIIVENSRKWNWVGHYSSMCEGVPPHALEWCEYYSCKIAECGFFRSNTCKVINSVDQKQVVTMNPCPAKYLCSYCLQIPHTQVFGCFDNSGGR